MVDFNAKIAEYLASQRKSWQPAGNYAYNAGHPCARHLVYQRLNWQEKPLLGTTTLLIFREGDLHEKAVLQLLTDAGIEVVETQRPFEIKEIQLRGRIDGRTKIDDRKVPTEIKSMNPHDFEKINSGEDMLASTKVWIRGYMTQMMLYLLGMNEEEGLFILKNKVNGELKFIIVKLDYEYAEKEWKKLESVNKHVAASTYPDRIEDRSVCVRCDFRHLCLPDEASDVLAISDDAELVSLLEEREKLRDVAKDYEAIDKRVKELLEPQPAGTYLVGGKFQVKISSYETTIYAIPPDVKEQFKQKETRFKTLITPVK